MSDIAVALSIICLVLCAVFILLLVVNDAPTKTAGTQGNKHSDDYDFDTDDFAE